MDLLGVQSHLFPPRLDIQQPQRDERGDVQVATEDSEYFGAGGIWYPYDCSKEAPNVSLNDDHWPK